MCCGCDPRLQPGPGIYSRDRLPAELDIPLAIVRHGDAREGAGLDRTTPGYAKTNGDRNGRGAKSLQTGPCVHGCSIAQPSISGPATTSDPWGVWEGRVTTSGQGTRPIADASGHCHTGTCDGCGSASCPRETTKGFGSFAIGPHEARSGPKTVTVREVTASGQAGGEGGGE